ncbi:MAG: hypothetical protein ACEQSF_06550 [Solirubrobacteraceae bacterium]
MKISAFTFLRNGLTYGYPFIESIKSLLPIVNEYIVVLGDSNDGSKEAILELNNPKIKIIPTIWDDNLRTGGKIFAQQANIGIENASKNSDWLFHLQADEVLHEKDYDTILKGLKDNLNYLPVDGFLLNFKIFFGDYNHYCPSRRFHQKEIRIIRNNPLIKSYKDSMGFRIFNNEHNILEKGTKLNVLQIDAIIYHYSYVRHPNKQKAKQLEFAKKYIKTDDFIADYLKKLDEQEVYGDYDFLYKFKETHPAVMNDLIMENDSSFVYQPLKNNMNFKEKFLKIIQETTGIQPFIYKNYKLIKK